MTCKINRFSHQLETNRKKLTFLIYFFFSVLLQTLLGGAALTASAAAESLSSTANTLSRLSDMGREKRSTSFAVGSSTSGGLELSQCLSHRIEAIVSQTASGSISGCQTRPTVIALPAPQAWMNKFCLIIILFKVLPYNYFELLIQNVFNIPLRPTTYTSTFLFI